MIRCPLLVYAGLGDDVCPPETAFDLQQVLTCDTILHTYPRCAHDAGIYWEQANVEAFLAEHLRPAAYQPANTSAGDRLTPALIDGGWVRCSAN